MHAAVVTSFDAPPSYVEHPDPRAHGDGEVVMEVLAAGLHPRVRSQADGSHYTTTGELPLVPGIDGVVRDPKGRIRYTVLDDTHLGTMAERTVIDLDRSVVLPSGIDPVQVAAAMNPAMSSWVALRRRIDFRRGRACSCSGRPGTPAGWRSRSPSGSVPGGWSRPDAIRTGWPGCMPSGGCDLHLRRARQGGRRRRRDRLRLG